MLTRILASNGSNHPKVRRFRIASGHQTWRSEIPMKKHMLFPKQIQTSIFIGDVPWFSQDFPMIFPWFSNEKRAFLTTEEFFRSRLRWIQAPFQGATHAQRLVGVVTWPKGPKEGLGEQGGATRHGQRIKNDGKIHHFYWDNDGKSTFLMG